MLGVRDYVEKNGFPGVILGLSGGIDSALVAAIAVDALGPQRVRAVMMPYRFTSSESLRDAAACAKALGVNYQTLPIEDAVVGISKALEPAPLRSLRRVYAGSDAARLHVPERYQHRGALVPGTALREVGLDCAAHRYELHRT